MQKRLEFRLRPGLQPGKRQETTDHLAKVLGRVLVTGFCAQDTAQPAVDAPAHRKPRYSRQLRRDTFRETGIRSQLIETADGPRVPAVERPHMLHQLVVGDNALAATRVEIDGVANQSDAPDSDKARLDERERETLGRPALGGFRDAVL